ncbi:MAG: hypothetical protein J7521_06310 [Caulobacter sp.]|nr:hypothetical protein [Caulobacter sp.]
MAAVAVVLGLPAAAFAREAVDPQQVDLAKLIECRTYDVPTYNSFGFWLAGTEEAQARASLGLTEVKSANFMLMEYDLARPITVFGRQTRRVAFTSSGPMAVLDEADPHPLAKALGVIPVVDAPGKFLGEVVVSETSETSEGSTLKTRVSLNVSTVTTHPGKTLAGCSYTLEIQ